jgi:phosphate transport system substrate-binding protein
MTVQEFERAWSNGVTNITEAVIGYDGIAIAQTVRNEPIALTTTEITLAVAAEVPDPEGRGHLVTNPYTYWDELNDQLPHRRIKMYGPPETSGTRDAFVELCMEAATRKIEGYGGVYTKIREDGVWIDSGENDELIVERLTRDDGGFGVFGFNYLQKNRDTIQGVKVDGVPAEFDTIESGEYPLSRSLYFYLKTDHLKHIPGMYEYVRLFMSEEMIGEDGRLTRSGLVPLPTFLREASRDRVLKLVPLSKREGRLSTIEDYANERSFVKK